MHVFYVHAHLEKCSGEITVQSLRQKGALVGLPLKNDVCMSKGMKIHFGLVMHDADTLIMNKRIAVFTYLSN